MTGLNKPSSHFLRKVWNQVLKNDNNRRRIEYVLKYYAFEKMERSDYKLLNDIYTTRRKKYVPGRGFQFLTFYGPKDYPWKKDTKFYLFEELDRICYDYRSPTFVIPHNWLLRYEPNMPIFFRHAGYHPVYLDLERQGWVDLPTYLLRDRMCITANLIVYPGREVPKPYFIGKGDEDWCITYLNIQLPPMLNPYFRSFLLMKNMDFSEFDAKIEAEGLKCPVYYDQCIKVKNNLQFETTNYTSSYIAPPCFCINCRQDYRAIDVGVTLEHNCVYLDLVDVLLK